MNCNWCKRQVSRTLPLPKIEIYKYWNVCDECFILTALQLIEKIPVGIVRQETELIRMQIEEISNDKRKKK
jgi:hypothetical protein